MDKLTILNKLPKEEDKLFIAKLLDKYQYATSKNKIVSTNFINLVQKELAKKILAQQKISNYLFYGAYTNCERCIIIFYPQKFEPRIIEANYKNIISIIRINLPKELHSSYSHRNYLGGLMKLGIEREKIGDILVFNDGADIIITKDMEEYLKENLNSLIRFKKAKINTISINELRTFIPEKETIEIIVPSIRLDSIIAELIHSSRNKACEYIELGKIFVNFELQTKYNKILKENDIVTIRGKGRFEISEIVGNTRKNNLILKIFHIKWLI